MAINLDKKEKKNSCLIPFLVVLVIIAALVAGIGLLWGVTGYIWFLRILGVIFAFVAFCGLSSASGVFDNYNMWYICCIMLLGRQYNRKKLCRVYAVCEYFFLDYQGLNYELIPQRNGNFNTELSSETEMF
jgi:hypothetical protein